MRYMLFLLLALAVCESGSAEPFAPTLAGPSWTIAYSRSMPPTLSGEFGGYFFDFPTSKDGVHYVIERAPPVEPGQTITMAFSLAGDGKLSANEGRSAAKVRLFIQRQGDTLTAKEPYKRWWSFAHVELVSPNTFTLSATINPSEWFSVFGAVGSVVPNEFSDCIANLAHLGFTFGGDFAGHGVYAANGAVRFILKDYSVTSKKNAP
jgi:hypothetical protein